MAKKRVSHATAFPVAAMAAWLWVTFAACAFLAQFGSVADRVAALVFRG